MRLWFGRPFFWPAGLPLGIIRPVMIISAEKKVQYGYLFEVAYMTDFAPEYLLGYIGLSDLKSISITGLS